MSFFKKIGNAIGNVAMDAVKIGAYPIAASVNSVTGHTWKPELSTKVGKVVGGITTTSVDSVHSGLKSFANAISLGYASKATDLLRPSDKKEAGGHYQELATKTNVKQLQKFDNVSKQGAVVAGTVYGGIALAKGAEKVGKALEGSGSAAKAAGSTNALQSNATPADTKSLLKGIGNDLVKDLLTNKTGNTGVAGNMTELLMNPTNQSLESLDAQQEEQNNQSNFSQQMEDIKNKVVTFFTDNWKKIAIAAAVIGAGFAAWKWYKGRQGSRRR